MESTNVFPEDDQARKLEKVFQIFARTQEDWAVAQDPGKSTGDQGQSAGDMKKHAHVSA